MLFPGFVGVKGDGALPKLTDETAFGPTGFLHILPSFRKKPLAVQVSNAHPNPCIGNEGTLRQFYHKVHDLLFLGNHGKKGLVFSL